MKPKYQYVMEAAVAVFVALTLSIPVAAILPYTTEDIDNSYWGGKKKQEIVHMKTLGTRRSLLSNGRR